MAAEYVQGVRLTDYQLEKLKEIAGDRKPVEVIRGLMDSLIDGKIEEDTNIKGLKSAAKEKGIKTQRLIELISEQLCLQR